VYGFLLSTGKGAFFYSPPLVLGALGLPTAWQRRRDETALIVGICLVVLLFNAKFRIWHADYCWGPRHLVPITPLWLLLCIPWLPEAMARGSRSLRRAALGLLLAAGLFIQVLGCTFYWDHYIRILIAMKDQTGAAGWFQESLSHGHYIPQFSPIRGHLWLLKHVLKKDPDLSADVPWSLIVPGRVNLTANWTALKVDWWGCEWLGQAKAPPGTRLPPRSTALVLLGLLTAGVVASGTAVGRRVRAKGADRSA
jgi:hypothetical protein